MKRNLLVAAVVATLSLAPLSASAAGVVLFNDWPQDFISNFWSAFSGDVAPYTNQLSAWVKPLPNTSWQNVNSTPNGSVNTAFDFLYDSGSNNPRVQLGQSTLNRVCSLIDPTAVSTNVSYNGDWNGSASAANANRVFIYTPNAVGGVPAGWSDWAQNHSGCPNSSYFCHYGVNRFSCTTYATPGQFLLASSYNIIPGQSVTLSWNDTVYRDTAWTYVSSHDYVPPSSCPADPVPDTVCSASGFTLSGSTIARKSAGTWDAELNKCFYGPDTKYSVFVANPTGSVTVSPTQTTTYSYTCTNANGTRTVSATVNVNAPTPTPTPTPTPVPGSCGSANGRTYAYGSSSYSPYSQCTSGSPSTTAFPSAGKTQSWTCSGANGGASSPACSASQAAPASCAATTIGNCNLSSTSSGGSSGSCSSGYVGSCNYSCSNGTWSAQTNSCALPSPAVKSFSITPTPVDQLQRYQVKWTCDNSSSASVWWRDNTGGWHESWPSEPASSSLTDWTTYNTLYEVDCHGYNGSTVSKQAWQTINAPTVKISEAPNPLAYGTAPSLTLSSKNANYCYVAVDWQGVAAGYFNSGTFTGPSNLSPGTHQAEAYCYNPDWVGSGWDAHNFSVSPPPPTASLSASPTTVNEGHSATLTWNSTFADSCTGTGFSTRGATNGNTSTGPLNTPGQENYELSCSNRTGTTNAFASVIVRSPQAQISASPGRVVSGGSVSVSWSASGVDSCSITRNGTPWKNNLTADVNGNLSGTAPDTIVGQTVYRIACANQARATAASATSIANIISQFKEF